MHSKIIEAVGSLNWGRFMVSRFTQEERSHLSSQSKLPVIQPFLWSQDCLHVLDLVTGEGAIFNQLRRGQPLHELEHKHQIWVCPLYPVFLTWLSQQDLSDLDKLQDTVYFKNGEDERHAALYGYRRTGRPST